MTDIEIYKKLSKLESLKPSYEVNNAFDALVKYATNINSNINLNNVQISHLCNMCSLGEYELEYEFASRILNDENLKIEDFVYYSNYVDLIDLEVANIRTLNNIKKVLFVGGGPLPLSAMILAQKYNLNVTILEKNIKAFEISNELIKKLNIQNIKIIKEDMYEYEEFELYDLIMIGALVDGEIASKISMIESIYNKLKSRALILVRTSHGARCLLYKKVDAKDFNMSPILEVMPYNHIVNSFLIFQK